MKIEESLKKCRREIDQLDSGIVKLIARRFALVRKIGTLKKQSGLQIRNKQRESEIIDKLAAGSGFRRAFIKQLYRTIFEEAYRIEK